MSGMLDRAAPAVRAEGLAKRFDGVAAVDEVSLEVAAGESVGLLGPNGAGKTTTVRLLTTLLPPDGGRAWVCGLDVATQPAGVRRLIGLSGQYAAVDGYLTGRENLQMIARLYGLDRVAAQGRSGQLLARLDLEGAADRTVRTYSGGMRRRLDIAASLVASPRVLFLDEPTTGLDPRGRLAVWDLLDELVDQGTSLLLTTQYMEEADRLADRVVVLGDGRVVAEGTPNDLKRRIGGYRLELRTTTEDAADVATALGGWGDGPPRLDQGAGRVVAPVRDGLDVVSGLRGHLADAHTRVLDVSLHRPTLDDVFLTLTGDPSTTDDAGPGDTPSAAVAEPRTDMSAFETISGRALSPPSIGVSTAVITRRNLLRLVRVPTLIALATVQPIFFVVLFTSVFGGAINPPGVDNYIDYLLPGLFVLAIGFGAAQTGVAIAEDLATGMTDRFRSLPLPGLSVLTGRVAADAVRNTFVVALMLVVATMIGFRFHAGAPAAVAAIALAIGVGLALSWINVLLGLLVRDAESAGLAGLFPLIVLVFTSSTLVPIETMPGWLQAFAELNPVTIVGDALRVLVLGGPTTQPVLQAAAWIATLIAITMPAAIRRWRRTV